MSNTLASGVGSFSQLKHSSNKVGGERWRCEQKKDQTSKLYAQSKNRCCLDSSEPAHKRHSEGTFIPQLRSLSRVDILFLARIQEMKACLGILPLNQICSCQKTGGFGWWIVSQVLAVEKEDEGGASPIFQRYLSSSMDWAIGTGEGRHFFSKLKIF